MDIRTTSINISTINGALSALLIPISGDYLDSYDKVEYNVNETFPNYFHNERTWFQSNSGYLQQVSDAYDWLFLQRFHILHVFVIFMNYLCYDVRKFHNTNGSNYIKAINKSKYIFKGMHNLHKICVIESIYI